MAKDKLKDDEVDVVIDAAAVADPDIVVDAPAADDWKAQFEAAQRKMQEAETARKEAERIAASRADEIERIKGESTRAKTQAVSAEMMAIDNALANTEHEKADARAAYKAALEAGDYEAAAVAQEAMATVAIKAQRIKEGKAEIERRVEAVKTQEDPIEQYVKPLSPRAADWVRRHPEVVRDSAKNAILVRSHHRAVGNDIAPDTDEYFHFMEQEMGYAAKDVAADADDDAGDDIMPARQQAAPAAPVSRGGAAQASNARQGTVKLSAAEREMAALCGLTDVEYAREKIREARASGSTH
jgi:hypothetical protein